MMEEESEQNCRKRAFTKEENGRGEEYKLIGKITTWNIGKA